MCACPTAECVEGRHCCHMRTNRKRRHVGRVVGWGIGIVIVAATWHAAAISVGDGALDLVPFTAPGVLIGLVVGWLSFAAVQREFTWQTGLYSALIGGVALPPWLSLLIVMSGLTAAGAVFLLVTGAWLAVLLGGFLALLRGASRLAIRWRAQARRRR